MKKIFEKIVEGILACSGFVTSLTIVLIVVFLFSEALGLFSSKVIEEGYVLALNKENRVGELTPAQIKDVFVRLFAAHYGDAVGQSVCHPFCIAVWFVGGNLYVGGSQFPGKESAETYH